MTKQEICQPIYDKHSELSIAMQGEDLELIKRLALELHSLVHPAEVSELENHTIADTVFEYMRSRGQNLLVPREDYETDLHYAGTKTVPLCWYFWHIYRIEDIVSNVLMANQDQIFNSEWQRKINSSITDTGNALELEEAIDFGKALNIDALYEYTVEVATEEKTEPKEEDKTSTNEQTYYPGLEFANTKLVDEEKIEDDGVNRVILTFEGEKNYTLMQEPSRPNEQMLPVFAPGDIAHIGGTIGSMTENSLSWEENGKTFFLASKDLTLSEMIEVASSLTADSLK